MTASNQPGEFYRGSRSTAQPSELLQKALGKQNPEYVWRDLVRLAYQEDEKDPENTFRRVQEVAGEGEDLADLLTALERRYSPTQLLNVAAQENRDLPLNHLPLRMSSSQALDVILSITTTT